MWPSVFFAGSKSGRGFGGVWQTTSYSQKEREREREIERERDRERERESERKRERECVFYCWFSQCI